MQSMLINNPFIGYLFHIILTALISKFILRHNYNLKLACGLRSARTEHTHTDAHTGTCTGDSHFHAHTHGCTARSHSHTHFHAHTLTDMRSQMQFTQMYVPGYTFTWYSF